LVKREIFSLLVFGGQDVLNEIGFVSQFRPFFPEGTFTRISANGFVRSRSLSRHAAFVPLMRNKFFSPIPNRLE
jgi:hypothetical protein